MSTDVLCQRMHYDIRTVLKRPHQIRRRKGTIDHQRKTRVMSYFSYGLNIHNFNSWIPQGLSKNKTRIFGNCTLKSFRITRVDEGSGNSKPR